MAATWQAQAAMPDFRSVAGPADVPAAVVELFTSQGCSSCPPADRYLSELAERKDVIALSEAVDYWDYLGWKDANARPEHTKRQQDYARTRGDRRVYTPQMVINGRVHMSGADRTGVEAEIKRLAGGAGRLFVPLHIEMPKDSLIVKVGEAAEGLKDMEATLLLLRYKRQVVADIKRGENRGRSISYSNVVTTMQPIGLWHGEPMQVELPASMLKNSDHDGCVVLLQASLSGRPGPIYGATLLDKSPNMAARVASGGDR